jgi:hypothetical protein
VARQAAVVVVETKTIHNMPTIIFSDVDFRATPVGEPAHNSMSRLHQHVVHHPRPKWLYGTEHIHKTLHQLKTPNGTDFHYVQAWHRVDAPEGIRAIMVRSWKVDPITGEQIGPELPFHVLHIPTAEIVDGHISIEDQRVKEAGRCAAKHMKYLREVTELDDLPLAPDELSTHKTPTQ